jgi:SAM-dependent methyltransferase
MSSAPIRRLAGRAGVRGRELRPYVLPGEARLRELRWERLLRRAPAVTQQQQAAAAGVGEIEEMLACDLCGEQRVQPLFEPRDRRRDPPRWRYHVVRCPSCGFLYRNPGVRPERLGDLYEGRYGRFLTGRYGARRQHRYRLVMDGFAPLFADGRGRRLLDFGCGAGLFLEVAHERGFATFGVDLSKDAVKRARRRPGGRNTWFGTPQDVPEIAGGGFHVVTMWSVLAHLATPVEDLEAMRRLLTPDGVLLLLTVNANSLQLKTHRDRWNGFTPNHLKFYAPDTLPLLLRRAGFGAVALRPMYGDAVEDGTTALPRAQERRLRRNVERGNQGNMMRAVAFADPDGPARWGLDGERL